MKLLIVTVLASVAAITANGATWDDQAKIVDECAKTNNVSEEIVQKLREGVVTDHPNVGSHILCALRKFDAFDSKGRWREDRIRAVLAPEIPAEDIEKVFACTYDDNVLIKASLSFFKCAAPHLKKLKYD